MRVIAESKLARASVFLCIAVSLISVPLAMNAVAETPAPAMSGSPEVSPPVLFSVRPAGQQEADFIDDLEILPGESVTLEAELLNYGGEAVALRVYKANAANAVNGGMQVGQEDEESVSLTSWIGMSPHEVTLTPGQSETVEFSIAIPPNTIPGQYISSIVAETVETMPIPGSTMFDQRIRFVMAVSVIVPGEIEYSFELGDPYLEENRVIIPIANTGDYLVKPEGVLELKNAAGQVILSAPIEMNSVYAGLSTTIEVGLSAQVPGDDYTLTLELTDPLSGSQAKLTDESIMVIEPEEPANFELISASVVPNDQDIVFATVDVALRNKTEQIPYSSVILEVARNGEVVEEYRLATNQFLLNGENTYSARYIPADLWESGTYTFRIILKSVQPETGLEVLLLDQEIDAEIVVP